ncbi:MAG: hypothetical protein FJ315_03555 [SAR202 cluster bacterium]|nr:hypothetical protein [SAR202 cluster bacterium]
MPCSHPLQPTGFDFSNGLIFYTSNSEVRAAAVTAVNRLRTLGVNPLAPRPLHIFHRDPINGNPGDDTDPFWSRYHPVYHAIQITRGGLSGQALTDTMYHEMGHALLGHQCVRIASTGDPHSYCGPQAPGGAMSEGWANFVALAIAGAPTLAGMDWENRQGCENTDPNPDIEYFVGCCLWDLFDPTGEDPIALPFTELLGVYSPTLQTLANGPIIYGVNEYVARLKQNNPSKAERIEQVRIANLVTPQQGDWRWCNKCQGLFFAGNPSQGVCKAGGTHSRSGSADYAARHV